MTCHLGVFKCLDGLKSWSIYYLPVCKCLDNSDSYRHNLVEGADGLAGGLYPQTVRQVEGLNSIIEWGGAKVGSTGGVGQGARVDGGLRSIVVDVGGEGGLLGIFAASASLLAATVCVASLSLGRSVSACTAVTHQTGLVQ